MKLIFFTIVLSLSGLSTQSVSQEIPNFANVASLNANTVSLFQQGLDFKSSGELELAAKVFRIALAVAPNYFPARRALVDTLLELEEYEAAEFHLRKLIDIDSNPNAQDAYYSTLDKIISKHPFKYDFSFAVLPSSNINNGTKNIYFDTEIGQFTINESGRESSGIGLYLGTSASHRWPLGNGQLMKLTGSLSGMWYDVESLRHIDGKLSLTYQVDESQTHWSVEPYIRKSWYIPSSESSSSDVKALGISVNYLRQLSEAYSLGVEGLVEDQSYIEKSYMSGPFRSATFKLEHRANADTLYSLNFGVQGHQPEAEHLAYQGLSLSAGVTKSWGNSFTTGITVGVGKRDYIENYTALTFPRMDQFYSIGMSVQNSKLKLFDTIPRINCTYKRNHSNVAFYDYQTTNCQISLTRNF